jgi:hypothetical protein
MMNTQIKILKTRTNRSVIHTRTHKDTRKERMGVDEIC